MTPELMGKLTGLAIDIGLIVTGLYFRGKPKRKVLGTVLIALGIVGFMAAVGFLRH